MVLTGGAILEEGEPANSPRAIAQAGPRAAMLLHRAADAALMGLPTIAAIPPAVADTVAAYVETARRFPPQGAQYLENHRGHLMFVKPEERPFVTADLIRATTITAHRARDQSTHRRPRRRRLQRDRHPDRPRPGTRDRGLGPDQAGVCVTVKTARRYIHLIAPAFAAELEALLREVGEPELAEQVRDLPVIDRCRCGDGFCSTFYTAPSRHGADCGSRDTIALSPETGIVNVDVIDNKIVCVEALYREDLKALIQSALT